MTTSEVARAIGRSRRDVTRLLDHPRHDYFPGAYRTPGGHWRVPESDVAQFLRDQRQAAHRVHRRDKADNKPKGGR